MDGGDLFASHETAVFDPAERSFAVLWQPTEGLRTSRIRLSELQGALQSRKLLTAFVSRKAYGKSRMKARDDQEEPPATTAGQPLFGKSRLKEDFQKSWDHLSEWPAQKHLNRWLWWASHSRPEPFQNLARMLREHLEGILAWTRRRVTHGAMEGTNNKVKLVSHRRFGFRNEDRYIEAIYHSCGNLPLPED